MSDISLHIWRKKHTFRHPWSGELLRIATYRLGTTPLTRKFQPTRGVGVVGLSWKYNKEVGKDVALLTAQLTDKGKFTDYQTKHGADSVMGLGWEEFLQINHRGAVFATPIRNGRSKFVGCISLDAERGYDQLASDRLWHELNSLSVLLAREGFQDV